VTTILEAAAAHPEGVKLTALSVLLDAPKSSVHGLVNGLLATGYLLDRDGPRVELNRRVSAIDGKRCAGNETRVIARQKRDRRGYVAGLAHASDGMLR
jgi:DNA-binding IclR family transcriptional regulator